MDEKVGRGPAAISAAARLADLDGPIEVEWYDSERVLLGWAPANDYLAALADRAVYRSAGYLVGEDEHHIMLALSKSAANLYGDAMVIPKAVIKSRRPLAIR